MPTDLSPEKTQQWWAEFNGDFINVKLPTVGQLITTITEGHAYTAQHAKYRKADNFICGQHVGLDFDTGDYQSSIEYLMDDEFIVNNASFIHTTASHTPDAPRSRVVFLLERPIYNREKYALLTEAFANTYAKTSADPSCKDPVRIFFGAEDCDYTYLGKMLSLDVAAREIVLPYKETIKYNLNKLFVPRKVKVAPPGQLSRIQESLLNKIETAPDGQKHRVLISMARTFGGYVAAGYFDEEEVKQLMYTAIASRPSTRNLNVAWNAIEFGVDAGKQAPLYLEEEEDEVLKKLFLQ
jgi:hypothetical protein